MIVAEDLHKSLRGVDVLRGASMDVPSGEAVALIGASGTGKTVMLKHLAGLMQPDRGRVLLDGEDLCCVSKRNLQQIRRKIGFLFQGGALFQSMTVYENVAFPLEEQTDLSRREIGERVRNELHVLGMDGSEQKYPAELSGGMAKRVALARALVQSPEIILFDEPTTGLDPIIAQSIHDLIADVRERLDITAVLVTHQVPAVFGVVDRVAMLHEGVVRFQGTPEEIMKSQDPVVKEFIDNSLCGEDYCPHMQKRRQMANQEESPK
ncbi:MAG: ABC transporter ATP-binding protein [Planctomycetota bacterium]